MFFVLVSLLLSLFLGWQLVKRLFPWLPGDLLYLKIARKMVGRIKPYSANQLNMADRLEELARSQPDKNYLLFEDEIYTYQKMNEWVNRTARALYDLGLKHGDEIALMMDNEPAYVAILLAGIRLGLTTALINHNQRSAVLQHSLSLLNSKLVIVGGEDELIQAVFGIQKSIDVPVISYSKEVEKKKSLKDLIDRQSSGSLEKDLKPSFPLTETALYIYTSGTTGKPKAVKIPHMKILFISQTHLFLGCLPDDIIYCALPFYHTAGCLAGLMCALNAGLTVAVRRHFSASNCIKDCIKFNATVLQYIGETMRYICLQPSSPYDRKHKLRAAYGNGIRTDVWKTFQRRFGPDIRILEFYAATEGNASFINLYGIPGAVGVCSPLMKALFKVAFVRYDHDKEAPYRDAAGRCVEVGPNEAGLVIRKIAPESMHCDYKGNHELTEKKIIRNVFKEGDSYYNSGDLLLRDDSYSVYFCDRLGDTFRWKGENVSTNEVSDVICSFPDVSEATVYGVKIKGKDGRAGMAAVTFSTDSHEDCMTALYQLCKENLPKYAIPLFVRIQDQLDHTNTMKLTKVKLKEEGYNLDKMGSNPVYFLHPHHSCYVRLTKEIVDDIESGVLKV